ncbi:MAG TPA: polysaccharide biosynthesis C-terminal domain-containing protein [Niabella sp.]|nr:polysaccharide biosynthesis C-terminal domain-containing protein [Niabella sp.]HOZ95581.1 polysaccharide biosynthesis C-terminal domain-containing protein [Niabella sp.]HQW13821.1 polysaccharide biosynthesis C-terminal domain-containing protein [Niabella sp.]HQX19286.1 polysaccharide biosynthesis C-terminal domain-containing protein [Niabella sp.]HQX41638.1 polysaccharide biosynthesis C-terminal domain-containing protein [Niabella sp.]
MSTKIRRQSILSSIVIYIGFAIGFLNTYFFTRGDDFSTEQYGLITLVTSSVVPLMASLSSMAMPTFIYKFFPFYNDNLEPPHRDMLGVALLVNMMGFLLVAMVGFAIEPMVATKYSAKSPLFVQYYYWVFVMGFGLTFYNVLEAYAWSLHQSVLTSYLKEVQWRVFTTVIIVLFVFKVIPDFNTFIKLYFFSFLSIAITLFVYLLVTKRLFITLAISRVTRKFRKKILKFCFFVYSANLVFTFSVAFDVIVIAAAIPDGAAKAAVFGLAQIMTSVIQAPQRGIVAATIPHLSQAWKNKNLDSIQRIYQRSSINMLIFASGLFVLIGLNYTDAIKTLGINRDYLLGFQAFVFLGLTKVLDLGTGVNGQIIGTSNYWRFELISGLILLLITMPLTYFLALKLDILGPAIAQFISTGIYNMIRIIFLYRKYKLFPFTKRTILTLMMGTIAFFVAYFLFREETGWAALIIRSMSILLIFGSGVYFLKLSPDLEPMLQSLGKRLRKDSENTDR